MAALFFDDEKAHENVDLEALQAEMTSVLIGLRKQELTDMMVKQESLRFPMSIEEEENMDYLSESTDDHEMHIVQLSEDETDINEMRSEIEHLNRRHLLCLIDRQDSLRWESQNNPVWSPSSFRPTSPESNHKAWDEMWEAEINSEMAAQVEIDEQMNAFQTHTERERLLQQENLRLLSALGHQRNIASKAIMDLDRANEEKRTLQTQIREFEKALETTQEIVEDTQAQCQELVFETEELRQQLADCCVAADKQKIRFANQRIELMQECKLQRAELEFSIRRFREEVNACTSEDILRRKLARMVEYENLATHIRARLEMIDLTRQEQPCVVCFDKSRTHAPVPCGHRSVCESCSESLRQCPICRAEATNFLKIYV